jgi:hypothetical protein
MIALGRITRNNGRKVIQSSGKIIKKFVKIVAGTGTGKMYEGHIRFQYLYHVFRITHRYIGAKISDPDAF